QYLARLCRLPVVVSVHFTVGRPFCEWAFSGSRRPHRIFFLSRGSISACRDAVEGIVPQAQWRLLYNGLDLDAIRPDPSLRQAFRREHGLTDELLIGNACPLQPRKQLEHLFEAAARLPHLKFKVVVAGRPRPGDEAYAEALLARAKHQLGDRL